MGFDLSRVFFVFIAQLGNIFVPEQRVVIEVHLGVERHDRTCPANHERVDFQQACIRRRECLVRSNNQTGRGFDLIPLETKRESDLPRMERLNARDGIDRDDGDLFRRRRRNFFDIHAAFGGGHDRNPTGPTVDQHAEVQLARDVGAFFDVNPAHHTALGAGLRRHQRHTENFAGNGLQFVERFDDFDTTALTATAGMDLRLNDPDRATEVLGHLYRLFDGISDPAARGTATPYWAKTPFAWYS